MKRLPFSCALAALLLGCLGCRRQLADDSGFPSAPPQESVVIGGLRTTVWRPSTQGPHPLILFSHGYKGSSTQSTYLTSYLADHGYLVIAPDHQDSSKGGNFSGFDMEPFSHPEEWNDQKYRDRGNDLANVIAALKKDPQWSGQINWDEVGLMGHSLGGYTVLASAGAWPSWKLPEVKAVVALSPFCAPFVQQDTLKNITVPVMYQGGTRDFGITPTVIKGGAAFDKTPSPTYYVELNGAGHFAWTDLNRRYADTVDYYCTAFFDRYLKGAPDSPLHVKRDDVSRLMTK